MRKPGKVVGFKIESERPEDSPRVLAIQLANFLQQEMNAKQDAISFRDQAKRERQKAQAFIGTLTMLQEYKRKKKKALAAGEEWKPSRMEPMETYDEEMLKAEKIMLINRAKDLEELAKKHDKIANEAKQESAKIQQRIKEAQS